MQNSSHILLLVVLDESFGLAVLAFQGLILGLSLPQVFIHSLAQALGLTPVALQLLHSLLILLYTLLQLGLLGPPAPFFLLQTLQLQGKGSPGLERTRVSHAANSL